MRYLLIALTVAAGLAAPAVANAGWCVEQCGLTRVPTTPTAPSPSGHRSVCTSRVVNGHTVDICVDEWY